MSTERHARAWVEVQAAAIRKNFAVLRAAMGPEGRVMPMVKADAYGLGVDRAIKALEPLEPCGYGVATVQEGQHLRSRGVERPILVCSPSPPGSYRMAAEAGLELTLSDLGGLSALVELRSVVDPAPAFQIEVDTGMGRAGFDWREAATWAPQVMAAERSGLRWTGVFTHLHSADVCDSASIRVQWERFQGALKVLGKDPAGSFVHVANSGGALRSGDVLPRTVRAGIFLWGGAVSADLPIPEPVAAVRARIVMVRDASPGTTLGYGSTYAATGWERWATLGIGYGDGLPRSLSNRGVALVGGVRVPIVGRISMDVTVVNISELDGVEVGDVATLIGREGAQEITVDEVAGEAGTISYEILTGLSQRLPRVWIDDGEG